MRKRIIMVLTMVLIMVSIGYTISVKASSDGQGTVSQQKTGGSEKTRKKLKITVEEDLPAIDIEDKDVPLAVFEDKGGSDSLPVSLLRRFLPAALVLLIACFLFARTHRYRTERRILRQITSLDDAESEKADDTR